jgi:hypothetical protein
MWNCIPLNYLPGQEVPSLAENYSDIDVLAQSKLNHMPEKFCLQGNWMEVYLYSQYGTTCEPSCPTTQSVQQCLERYAQTLTGSSSAAGFPVKIFPSQGKALGWTGPEAVCGSSSPALLATFDPVSHSWRTVQHSLFEEDGESLLTLPPSGMTRNGRLYRRPMPAPSTLESDCGYWRTPTVSDVNDSRRIDDNPRLSRVAKGHMLSLAAQVRTQTLWPTPTINGNYNKKGASASSGDGLITAVMQAENDGPALWQTPQAHDHKKGYADRVGRYQKTKGAFKGGGMNLTDQVQAFPTPSHQDGKNITFPASQKSRDSVIGHIMRENETAAIQGQLNPDWTEWLMNWPVGWTSIDSVISKELTNYYDTIQQRANNAKSKNIARETMPSLLKNTNQKTIRRKARRFYSISKKDLLQQYVRKPSQDEREPNKISTPIQGAKIQKIKLQNLWGDNETASPSQRRKPIKQRPFEPRDIMHILSRETSLDEWERNAEATVGLQNLWDACKEIGLLRKTLSTLQEVWRSMSYEEKNWVSLYLVTGNPWCIEPPIKRVCPKQPHAAQRIKAIGNGQVPQAMALAWRILFARMFDFNE